MERTGALFAVAQQAATLEPLIDTSTILGAAETYLLITRLTGWDLDAYQAWIATTVARLIQVPEGNS